MQPTQAVISSSLPLSAFWGICGSEINARVIPHMSAALFSKASSAICGVLMRPATKTGLLVTPLIAFASGVVYPASNLIEGTMCVDPANPAEVPAVTFI